MRPIHDIAIVLLAVFRLGAKYAAEEFGHFSSIAVEGYYGYAGDDGVDTVSTAFDFSVEEWRFVTLVCVVYVGCTGCIHNGSHCDSGLLFLASVGY